LRWAFSFHLHLDSARNAVSAHLEMVGAGFFAIAQDFDRCFALIVDQVISLDRDLRHLDVVDGRRLLKKRLDFRLHLLVVEQTGATVRDDDESSNQKGLSEQRLSKPAFLFWGDAGGSGHFDFWAILFRAAVFVSFRKGDRLPGIFLRLDRPEWFLLGTLGWGGRIVARGWWCRWVGFRG